jgi:SAM-dependent methyltransferase
MTKAPEWSGESPGSGTPRSIPEPESGFPEEAFEHLAALEDGHFWFRSRSRLIVWALERHFPEAKSLLEVGTGSGVVLQAIRARYPSLELVGVDQSSEALRHAATRVDARLLELDAQDLPFDEEFDVVCAFDVLEHVDDDERALAELAAAARPRGGLLVTVPQYDWLWSQGDDYGRHRRRYTKRDLETTVERAGFTVVRSTAWVFSLLPVLAASRLWEKRRRGRYDPKRELELPKPINRALEAILDAERLAIERGVTLPFGSSRLVVAEKR